jgi:hypothetical protein
MSKVIRTLAIRPTTVRGLTVADKVEQHQPVAFELCARPHSADHQPVCDHAPAFLTTFLHPPGMGA